MIPVPLITYEILQDMYGEKIAAQFWHPVSVMNYARQGKPGDAHEKVASPGPC